MRSRLVTWIRDSASMETRPCRQEGDLGENFYGKTVMWFKQLTIRALIGLFNRVIITLRPSSRAGG